jgi:hypothetical protein
MRKDYEEWEVGLGKMGRYEKIRSEGYPFYRVEQIVVGGVISGWDDFSSPIPVGGNFMMSHPTCDDRFEGKLVSALAGETYVQGRATEEGIDYIEFYGVPHSEGCSREYHLVKCAETGGYEGRFSCDNLNKQLASGFVKLDIVKSVRMIKPDNSGALSAVPQGMNMNDKYAKIESFFDRLK